MGEFIESKWQGVEVFYVRQELKDTGRHRRIELTAFTREEAINKMQSLEAFVSEELKVETE